MNMNNTKSKAAVAKSQLRDLEIHSIVQAVLGGIAFQQEQHRIRERELTMDPNRGCIVKIVRYTFSLTAKLRLGIRSAFPTLSSETKNGALECGSTQGTGSQPDARIRPQEIRTNTPFADMVWLNSLQCANIGTMLGLECDSFVYREPALVDFPTMDTSNRLSMHGYYTGRVSAELAREKDGGQPEFTFCLTLIGPAEVCSSSFYTENTELPKDIPPPIPHAAPQVGLTIEEFVRKQAKITRQQANKAAKKITRSTTKKATEKKS
jgi:hypothetical protein